MDTYLWDSGVDVRTVGFVDDDALVRILGVIGDVVVHHNHDVLVLESSLLHYLVRVAHVCLVTVVFDPAMSNAHFVPPFSVGSHSPPLPRPSPTCISISRRTPMAMVLLPS